MRASGRPCATGLPCRRLGFAVWSSPPLSSKPAPARASPAHRACFSHPTHLPRHPCRKRTLESGAASCQHRLQTSATTHLPAAGRRSDGRPMIYR
ncbi:hypothetical protein B0H15DRAFT_1027646 [Mycena belliarum]|uniref:Uncharacterized protein n=1 Tax=Mycena belliarum TaxID=1033014 RepID=A0AAD6TSA7_9AGAR|nr:hypothetical protein B0H15DRAFT_1027646 [Mycena belliae]